jgi:1,4-dihydroxy-2-naphthoate octaprenyltransferase
VKISSFFKLVEIQTKVASLMPFILGILFTYDRYRVFHPQLVMLFFISMICLDMGTTTINNFMDYKRAIKKEGYNFEEHNAMGRDDLSDNAAIAVIFILLCIAAGSGLVLYLKTDWVILFLGILSFGVGVLYSYGPIPISRTPLGELFSGVFMGGFIFFIVTYIQVFEEGFIIAYMRSSIFHLHVETTEIVGIFAVSIPLILMISNIMLANNICDIEDDIQNKRYTLPYFLGRERSLRLFAILYALCYLAIVICVIIRILPIANLLVLITVYPIYQHIKRFKACPDKATMFVLSVKNLILFSLIWIISFIISIVFTSIF